MNFSISILKIVFLTCLMYGSSGFAGIKVTDGWEYFRGDLDVTQEIKSQANEAQWLPLENRLNISVDGTEGNIWMRFKLGEVSDQHVLYLEAMDQDFEVFVGNDLIFKHGAMDHTGKGVFIDWRPHFIDLREDFSNQFILFRIYSNHFNIGVTGTPLLESKINVFKHIFLTEIDNYIVSIILIVMSLIFFTLLVNSGDKALFIPCLIVSFAGASFLFCTSIFPYTLSKTFDWLAFEVFSLSAIPVGFVFYLASCSTGKMRSSLYMVGLLNTVIMLSTAVFVINDSLHVKDILLLVQFSLLTALLVCLISVVVGVFNGKTSFKILFAGAFISTVGIGHDILKSILLIDSDIRAGTLAGFALFVSMVVAAIYEYKRSLKEKSEIEQSKDRQNYQLLEERMEAISILANGVAKELRDPLASLSATSRLLNGKSENNLENTDNEIQGRIDQVVSSIKTITKSLMLVSKGTTVPVNRVPFSVLVDNPLKNARRLAREKKVELIYENPPSNVYLECVLDKLEEAILNVIGYSLDAAAQSDTKLVKVTFNYLGKNLLIKVRDSGKCLNEVDARKVFQPFYKASGRGDESGLSLPTAYRVIKSINGDLGVDISEGYSCFSISIPARLGEVGNMENMGEKSEMSYFKNAS